MAGLQKGTRLVQLGAFDSEAITRQAWNQLVAKNPDLLRFEEPLHRADHGKRAGLLPAAGRGLHNTDQTREMCEALRARGIDCIPVTLQ